VAEVQQWLVVQRERRRVELDAHTRVRLRVPVAVPVVVADVVVAVLLGRAHVPGRHPRLGLVPTDVDAASAAEALAAARSGDGGGAQAHGHLEVHLAARGYRGERRALGQYLARLGRV